MICCFGPCAVHVSTGMPLLRVWVRCEPMEACLDIENRRSVFAFVDWFVVSSLRLPMHLVLELQVRRLKHLFAYSIPEYKALGGTSPSSL